MSETTRAINEKHWHEGGTHITNFKESMRAIYLAAVESFDDPRLVVSANATQHAREGYGGALHWVGEERLPDLSYFWRLFDIEILRAELAAANERIAALTAQPNTQRLLDALSIAQDAIMECLKYPEMPPEVIEQADERRLT